GRFGLGASLPPRLEQTASHRRRRRRAKDFSGSKDGGGRAMESPETPRERVTEAALWRDLGVAGCTPEESESLVSWWRREARFRGRLRADLRGRGTPPPCEPARKLRVYAASRER